MADLLGGAAARAGNGATRAGGPTPVRAQRFAGPHDVLQSRQERIAARMGESNVVAGDDRRRRPQQPAPSTSRASTNAPAATPAVPAAAPEQPRPSTSRGQEPAETSSTRPAAAQSTQPRPSASEQPSSGSQPPNPGAPQPKTSKSERNRPSNTFPHAFERWETLSSHWEGLTSYWLRKLEQNKEELETQPLGQQMGRQITDLSAAGANLFHAVVELQRLRASSEKKFQRWFFESQAEKERSQEIQGELESLLRTERNLRAEAVDRSAKLEADKITAEKMVNEMRRELQISKDEARRAWEELGRRQQEEQDRITSLSLRQPTIVGGIQVFPMLRDQGTSSVHSESHSLHHEPDVASLGHQTRLEDDRPPPAPKDARYTQATTSASIASTSRTSGPATSQGQFYHHPAPAVQGANIYDDEDALDPTEYAIDENGEFKRDREGRRIPVLHPLSDESADDYDQGHPVSSSAYTAGSTSTAAARGYGGEFGYLERHHHPTRLSDVVEEDERSRTTASRASSQR